MILKLTPRANHRVLVSLLLPILSRVFGTKGMEVWAVAGDGFQTEFCRRGASALLAEHGQELPKVLKTVTVRLTLEIVPDETKQGREERELGEPEPVEANAKTF